MYSQPNNDYRPLTWIGRVPVYFAGVIAALVVVGMFATAFLKSANVNMGLFIFVPSYFYHGALWQVFTYWLINPPDFFFAFSVLFFAWFGTDVERYLGRTRFFQLFGIVILTPVLASTLWWLLGINSGCGGMNNLSIGFFIAFATLYPNLEFWGWIQMKWLAFAGIVLQSMNYLPYRDWVGLTFLLTTCAVSFGFIRFLQNGAEFPSFAAVFGRIFRRKPKFKVVPRETSPREEVHESIDPLLDKISKHGLSSLTAREKTQLERARKSLLENRD